MNAIKAFPVWYSAGMNAIKAFPGIREEGFWWVDW